MLFTHIFNVIGFPIRVMRCMLAFAYLSATHLSLVPVGQAVIKVPVREKLLWLKSNGISKYFFHFWVRHVSCFVDCLGFYTLLESKLTQT